MDSEKLVDAETFPSIEMQSMDIVHVYMHWNDKIISSMLVAMPTLEQDKFLSN